MNTLSVSQETRPAQITSRRGTLERQCSIGTHSNPATLKDVTPDPSSLSTLSLSRASFSSSHSLSTGQSVDEVFGVPDTLETKTSTSSSNDKSNSASTIQMSKAGRKRKHPMKPGKYICKYCSKPCAKPSVLEKHLRKHTGERPFPCDACDHSFKTRSNLYKHLKSSTHLQKCKEKGISMESLYGESFGSSRDESLDMDGEEETPALQLHKRASSVGGFTDRKPYPPKQPSYLETLRDLEKVYDAIDAYARMMGTVVCKHSHWLLDKDCIISVHLQHPPAVLAGNNGAVDVGSKSDKAIDVQARITNLLKVNDEIINSPGKRRLSRQQSVSSPSNQMLNSEPGASQGQLGPQATPDMSVVMHQISARSYLDTKSRLPDGEELLKHIREIIQLNPSFDSNIKLLMHEHVMEVKLKLFIPDAAARRKCIQGLSVDSSIDNQHGTGRGLVKERRFPCEGCNQSFSREHILEIHSSFFCYGLLPENRKKMKLLKTGSEDSYVYVIADDGYSPSKYVKVAPEVSLQSAVLQQSSVGNLTKHMRSKAHHRRCLELHIIPVPLTVEDNQIDRDILASQHRLSRQSKIQGAKLSEQEKALQEDSDSSEDDEQSEEEEASEESSEDDALHIDESSDDADKSTDSAAPRLNMASLRRVQSMPAHHQANSFDASSLAEIMQTESETQAMPSQPPPKKRKRNHLNLTLNAGELQGKETNLGRCTEDDVAMSLLDLSKTPVHGTPTFIKQNSLSKPLLHTGSTKSPLPADVQRVSVVRSTKASADDYPVEQDYNEPIDLRIHSKAPQLRFICPLCRAICNSQESLEKHMKLHDGPVIEVSNKSNKRLMSSSHSLGNSFDADSRPKSQTQIGQPLTPQTPGPLRRQQAINIFDSDAEDDVDHTTKVEPGEMLSEEVLRHKCPYCPKVFHSEDSVPLHIKSHHVITQEYVCTYKDCGVKFSNKQDLTYHLGSHALDDNEKYQPISIPKCGICEKTFKSMNSLKQHLQHHSDARPHICEYCDAGFTTSQFLKNHLKTHTQERPYVCGECDSTFARSDHLTQHAKTHNKQLPCDMQNRVAAQAPTILNPAGAKLHHHLTL
ncbi:uncharacterized protein [Watersipora subatra]|uniref:uncharacterized protein n=1 Tax=Watersipora subatra TaxID=2589382 RepID=UPI00355C5B76